VKNDIQSSVCWHAFGLMARSDLNYKESSKCYLNALRIDPNNQNILRDLSWLQVQLADYAGTAYMKEKR
jgi:peptide alpha-N-acetyltransferase